MCPRHVIQAAGQQDMDGEDKQTLPDMPVGQKKAVERLDSGDFVVPKKLRKDSQN